MSHPSPGEPPAGRSPSTPRLSRPAASGPDESGFYRVGGTGRRTSRTTRERGESIPTWIPPRPRRSRLPWRAGKGRATTPEELRFALVYAAVPVGPMRYEGAPVPDVALARAWVRALAGESPGGGADGRGDDTLHALIASWAAGWVARVDSEHLDHETDLDRLVGLARHRLAAAEASHDRDHRALVIAGSDRDHVHGLLHRYPEAAEARVLRRRRWRGWWRRAMSAVAGRRTRSSADGGPRRRRADTGRRGP